MQRSMFKVYFLHAVNLINLIKYNFCMQRSMFKYTFCMQRSMFEVYFLYAEKYV